MLALKRYIFQEVMFPLPNPSPLLHLYLSASLVFGAVYHNCSNCQQKQPI